MGNTKKQQQNAKGSKEGEMVEVWLSRALLNTWRKQDTNSDEETIEDLTLSHSIDRWQAICNFLTLTPDQPYLIQPTWQRLLPQNYPWVARMRDAMIRINPKHLQVSHAPKIQPHKTLLKWGCKPRNRTCSIAKFAMVDHWLKLYSYRAINPCMVMNGEGKCIASAHSGAGWAT